MCCGQSAGNGSARIFWRRRRLSQEKNMRPRKGNCKLTIDNYQLQNGQTRSNLQLVIVNVHLQSFVLHVLVREKPAGSKTRLRAWMLTEIASSSAVASTTAARIGRSAKITAAPSISAAGISSAGVTTAKIAAGVCVATRVATTCVASGEITAAA